MSGIIMGLVFAFIISGIFWLFLMIAIDGAYSDLGEMVLRIIRVVVCVGVIIAGGTIGYISDTSSWKRYVDTYNIKKATYEASLQNETLSGLERMELVRRAAEANGTLAGYKYDCQQWYGWNMDKRILDLEFIDLAGAGKD